MNKRYWLRGGIVFFLIGIISVLLVFFVPQVAESFPIAIFFLPVLVLEGFLSLVVLDLRGTNSGWGLNSFEVVVTISVVLLVYFILGTLFGRLYDKIKNKNKVI